MRLIDADMGRLGELVRLKVAPVRRRELEQT